MALTDAKMAYNRLIVSLVIVIVGTLALSYFLSIGGVEQPITGQFVLNQTIFFAAIIVGLLTVGVVMLKMAVSR